MVMRIAYLTLDEVNENLATLMADECGATLVRIEPRDPKPDGEFDAVLYDLDSLPPPHRKELLSVLLSSRPLQPVGMHSYQLEEDEQAALRRCGLLVSRHIEKAVFQALCSPKGHAQFPRKEPLLRSEQMIQGLETPNIRANWGRLRLGFRKPG
jgi:hypothetical protein